MGIGYAKSREALDRIKRHRKNCLIIHYACQSLFDDKEGHSPRIANIVVADYENNQTASFAIHMMAEKSGVAKADIGANFDKVERLLLEEFYEFVRNHPGNIWVHWNMKNLVFGFEVLAHRYGVLTGKNAPSVDIDNRINLAELLIGRYGEGYADVPHIPKLMELNGGIRRDFVPGKEEVDLFDREEFSRLHSSTVSKVSFFRDVMDLVIDNKLKVKTLRIYDKIDRGLDHVAAKIIGVLASLYTIIDLALKALH